MLAFMAAIQRLMSSAERGLHKSLAVLRQLQKDRGFVPQKVEEQPEVVAPEPIQQAQPTVHLAQTAPNPAVFTRFVPPLPNSEPTIISFGGSAASITG